MIVSNTQEILVCIKCYDKNDLMNYAAIDNENIAIMEDINNGLAEMQNIFPDTCECCNKPSISVLCEDCQDDIIFQRLEEEDFLEYLEIVDSFND